jgi:hypothetical protein
MTCCTDVSDCFRKTGGSDKLVLENRNSRRLPGFRYVFIHRRQIQGAANILDHCFFLQGSLLEIVLSRPEISRSLVLPASSFGVVGRQNPMTSSSTKELPRSD